MGLSYENQLCKNCSLYKVITNKCGFWNKAIDKIDICPRVEPSLSQKYVEMVTPKKPRGHKNKWALQ